MRKSIITAVALSAIFMTGCATDDVSEPASAQSQPEPSALPTEEPTKTAAPKPEKPEPAPAPEPEPAEETTNTEGQHGLSGGQVEEVYTSMLRTQFPRWFGAIDDETMINTGQMMCMQFENGATFEEVAMVVLEAGYPQDVGATYIGYTVEAFCPDLGVLD